MNFTVQDVAGSVAAVVAFALVLYGPGYLLAWGVDLFGFRRRSLAERSCWAVVCSFGGIPVVAYLLGKFLGLGVVCWGLVVVGVVALNLMYRSVPQGLKPVVPPDSNGTGEAVPLRGPGDGEEGATGSWRARRDQWLGGGLALAWVVFVISSLVEVQIGKKLYFSVAMFDQSYRVAFTNAVARTGVPPANPLYFAGHASPMRYYYFWYVLCAAVMRIAGVTARQAFIASSVWAGFGLVAMVALYLRHFFGVVRGLRHQTLVAVGLLLVTGADLLPAMGSLFAQKAVNGEMEWWSEDQISSWMDSLLWVPHHVAALLCCLLSFLLLWRTREALGGRQRWVAVGIAGVAFASGFGLSIYVAFGMALLMVMWALRARRELALGGRVIAAGMVAGVLLVPFLRELMAGQGSSGSAGHVFALSVRRFIDPSLLTGLPVFGVWQTSHPLMLDLGMRLVLLVPGLALELGCYGVALWMWWWVRRRDEAIGTAVYLAICGLAMVTFIRSAVIGNNDFGYRAALLPQFFLLLLGVRLVASWWMDDGEALVPTTRAKRSVLVGLMVLGVAGTVYQAGMLRLFLPLEAARPESGFAALPGDAFDAREAFAAMRRVASADAVVEFHAMSSGSDANGDVVPPSLFYERALVMDAGRQVLNAEPGCAVEFGGDQGSCAAIRAATTQLYAASAPSAGWAVGYCTRFGVDYLVVAKSDTAWGDRNGWVWSLPVVAEEPGFRILRCAAL